MKLFPINQIILLAVICCHLHYGAGAQYKFDNPIYLSKEQGLSANQIRVISKGPDGFIWIGVREGLCRFDGQQLKVYKEGKDLRYSLFDNTVNAILPLRDEVWLATNQGISVLNISKGQFRHYQLGETGKTDSLTKDFNYAINTLRQDASGNIWVGTVGYGAWRYDKTRDNFRRFTFAPSSYPIVVPLLGSNNTILSMEPSNNNDSIIWAGTIGGLQEINKFTGLVKLHVFPQKDKDYQVAVNAFRRLYQHTDGLLYVGNWSAGIHVFDPSTKTLKPLPVGKDWWPALKTPTGSIYRKSDHEIWITTLNGLLLYDTHLQDITWAKFNDPSKNLYYGITCIDEHNRVWYGNINGIQYFDPVMQQFTNYSFRELYGPDWAYAQYMISDKAGRMITVCPIQANGLYVFDKLTRNWTKLPFKGPAPVKKIEVRGCTVLEDGRLLLSSKEGLFTYNLTTQQLQAMKPPPTKFNQWRDAIKDKRGRIWLTADMDGLICWDQQKNTFRNYKKYIWPNDTSGIPDRAVNLYADSHNNIWFTRVNGLGVYLADRDSIVNFMYTQNKSNSFPFVHRFSEDGAGRVWMTSNAGWMGFARLASPEKGIVSKVYLPDKKIDGRVYSLTSDLQGHVWGFTDKMLFRITGDSSFNTFNFQYGVQESDFYHFSFLPSGEMILGGRNNIILANPETFKRNEELPTPYISELQVLNQPYTMPPLFNDTTLDLSYQRNFFTIGFSAQAYTLANEVRFRYRLQEFDEWKEVTGRNAANYTNVPPGKYTFQLQAANNEGVWNPKMLQLFVHVATPWWQTWWFRISTLLVIAGIVYWLYRFRIKQVRKKAQLKSQYEKKLANVEMSALLAQMNPHFLFNSLNSIDSYIIKNESKKASEYLNSFARLMRLILQNSRSNYISLKDELETLELYLQMEGLRFRDQFQYEIKIVTKTDTSAIVIPPMLIQPYVENAIWHGLMHKHDGTARKVELLVEERDNNLFCVIQDNGVGRAKAQAFRAYKLAGKKRSMGMQITRDRIEIINKLYDVNTAVTITDLVDATGNAVGTRVELVIPV